VQKGGALVGILSDRDLKLARSFPGASELVVDDVMTPDPYVVELDTPLDEVAFVMAQHKYGCAVVVDTFGRHAVGIFTANDALKCLGETLRERETTAA
jgi:CBS domain-containing protein